MLIDFFAFIFRGKLYSQAGWSEPFDRSCGNETLPRAARERDKVPKQVEHISMGANEALAKHTKVDVRLLLPKRLHVVKGGL